MRSTIMIMVILMMLCLYHKVIAASATFSITATVLRPVIVTETQALSFPNEASTANNESISASTNEQLSIQGEPDSNVTINVEKSEAHCVSGNCKANDTVTVDQARYSADSESNGDIELNDQGQASHITLTANEEIKAATPSGQYEGDYTSEINYS